MVARRQSPIGLVSSKQMRKLAFIAREYEQGLRALQHPSERAVTGPRAGKMCPDILPTWLKCRCTAIQTAAKLHPQHAQQSVFAGVAADELVDPRPWCEIIRQWSTFPPGIRLPAASSESPSGGDRRPCCHRVHDIGLMWSRTTPRSGLSRTGWRRPGRTPWSAARSTALPAPGTPC